MPGVDIGPCGTWPGIEPICNVDDVDADDLAWARAAATLILWSKSGMRYSVCEIVLRPCAPCGHCEPCGCPSSQRAPLDLTRWGPVASVDEVKIDGAVFEEWIYQAPLLYRTDGEPWPRRQRDDLPDTDTDTWSVTITQGLEPDVLGLRAAGELACELLKLLNDREACTLPTHITSVVRPGVTFTYESVADLREANAIGLPLCDQWLDVVNPHGDRSPSTVFSPDLPVRR